MSAEMPPPPPPPPPGAYGATSAPAASSAGATPLVAPLMSGHQLGRVISLSRWIGYLLLFVGLLVDVIGVLPSGASDVVTANFVGKLIAVIGLAGILLSGGLGLEFAAPFRPGADAGEVSLIASRMKIDAAMVLVASLLLVLVLITV